MTSKQVWSLVTLVGAAVAIGGRPGAAAEPSNVSIFNTIKGLESRFPLPQPRATVNVGTYDAPSGQWTGLKSTQQVTINPVTHKPLVITLPAVAPVNAVAISLRFSATGGPVTFSVTPTFGSQGPGATTSVAVPAFQSRTVDIGRATSVVWSAIVGSTTYTDKIVIQRPKIVGVGVFKIPALPVALVYEPPSVGGSSTQTYTVEHSVGTAVKMELTQEESTSTPGSPSHFATTADLQSTMTTLSGALKLAGKAEPVFGQIAAGLDQVVNALGSATATNTSETVRTQVSAQELKITLKRAISPNSNLGPGKGDIISVLLNARMVWMVVDGDLTLALLGFDGIGTWAVKDLVATPGAFPVDPATIQELLKLDPFVTNGPATAPPSPRFTFDHYESVSNATVTWSLTHAMTQTDLTASSYSQIRMEDYREGMLSFLGIGPDETKRLTTKVTHSNSTAVSVGSTTSAAVTLNVVGSAEFNIWFDRIFGTFAVTKRIQINPAIKDIRGGGGLVVFAP